MDLLFRVLTGQLGLADTEALPQACIARHASAGRCRGGSRAHGTVCNGTGLTCSAAT